MIRKLFKLTGRVISLVLLSFTLFSCVQEEPEQCDLYLRFSYTYNMENNELFQQEVEQIKVFFYDKNNKFVGMLEEKDKKVLEDSNYKMKVPFEYTDGNEYRAVVWAGNTEGSYIIDNPQKGDDISTLVLHLITANNESSTKISQLWHGYKDGLVIDEGVRVETVSLVRSTNNIKFTVNGESIGDNYTIKIISDNGKYDYFHKVVLNGDITYLPHTVSNEGYLFTTLRFIEGHPIKISVLDKNSNNHVTIKGSDFIDIVDYVLKSKPNEMENQEYLDREYNWVIDLAVDTINTVAISITINGWTVWFNNTEL